MLNAGGTCMSNNSLDKSIHFQRLKFFFCAGLKDLKSSTALKSNYTCLVRISLILLNPCNFSENQKKLGHCDSPQPPGYRSAWLTLTLTSNSGKVPCWEPPWRLLEKLDPKLCASIWRLCLCSREGVPTTSQLFSHRLFKPTQPTFYLFIFHFAAF